MKDEGAGAFPPFSHSWHLKQNDMEEESESVELCAQIKDDIKQMKTK
jgi:hypothetical protein